MKGSNKFYFALAAIAFGLNLIWEIAQLFAYAGDGGDSWAKSFLLCALAAVIDAAVTLVICVFLKAVMKADAGAKFYLSAAVSGAFSAVAFERFGLRFGLWSYGERMIVLPVIGVGLLPFAQLTLLAPLAIWLAKKFRGV